VKSCRDLFRYDDGYLNSADWLAVAGAVWVEDNAAQLGAADNQAIFLRAVEADSLEHLARCSFNIDADSDVPYVGLMVRAEYVQTGSPAYLRRCYLVTIDGAGGIRVYSILMGTDPAATLIGSCNLTLESDDRGNGHLLIVKVRDAERGADIRVFVDDDVTPVLTVIDTRTTRPEGLYVGFELSDASGNQVPRIGEFYAHVLRSSVIRNPYPIPVLKNFGDLKYELGYRLDRAGNSQFDDSARGELLNYALNEVWLAEGYWRWCLKVKDFVTRADTRFYELPAYVGLEYDLVNQSMPMVLGKTNMQHLFRLDPGSGQVGTASGYAVVGIGDFGGPVIMLDRTPAGAESMLLPYYAKPVPMVEDTEIPLIPPEYLEVLIFGALKRASAFAGLQRLTAYAAAEHESMLAKMRRANHRTVKGNLHLRTVEQMSREQVATLRPMTRLEQLGV
jgi:hypothetical protein